MLVEVSCCLWEEILAESEVVGRGRGREQHGESSWFRCGCVITDVSRFRLYEEWIEQRQQVTWALLFIVKVRNGEWAVF